MRSTVYIPISQPSCSVKHVVFIDPYAHTRLARASLSSRIPTSKRWNAVSIHDRCQTRHSNIVFIASWLQVMAFLDGACSSLPFQPADQSLGGSFEAV